MPLSWVFLPSNYQHSPPFSSSIRPLPFKSFSIFCDKLPVAFLLVMCIPTFISWTVFPMIDSKAVFFSIREPSLVRFSIFITHETTSGCQLIIWKFAFILPLISTFIDTFTMFFSSYILSFIRRHISRLWPSLTPFTIRKITLPLAFISIPYALKGKYSSTLSLLLVKFSFVVPTLWANESSLTWRDSFNQRAFITATIRIDKMPWPMGHSLLPFAIGIVDESHIIDSICWCVFGSNGHLKAGSRLKRPQFLLYLDDIGMLLWYMFYWWIIFDELILTFNSFVPYS